MRHSKRLKVIDMGEYDATATRGGKSSRTDEQTMKEKL